jgi:hypothetical protein
MSHNGLKFGLYEGDLNPALGLPIAGYSEQKKGIGFYDRLYVKAVSLKSGDTRVLLASVDTCGVGKKTCDAIREETEARHGVPRENVVILATHTHSAPDMDAWTPRMWASDLQKETNANRDRTKETICWSLSQAMALEEPVDSVTYSSTQIHGIFTNRNDPSRKIDNEVSALMLKGKKTLLLVNHNYHPTILGANNYYYSADFPAYLTRRMNEKLGPTQVNCITGSCGDVSVRLVLGHEFSPRRNIGNTIKYGNQIGDSLVRCLKPGSAKKLKDSALVVKSKRLKFHVKKHPDKDEALSLKTRIEEEINNAKNLREKTALQFKLEGVVQWLNILDLNAEIPPTLEVDTGSVSLGTDGFTLAWAPGEVCSHTGLTLKDKSKYKVTMLSGYGNAVIGYIPPPESYEKEEYEALSTPVTGAAIKDLEETLVAMVS